MLKNINLFFALLVVLATACGEPEKPGKKEILGKSWTVKSVTINGADAAGSTTVYTAMTFSSAGSYTFTKTGAAPETGTWVFDGQEKNIILDQSTSKEQTIEVLSFSAQEVKLEFLIPSTYKEQEKQVLYTLQ